MPEQLPVTFGLWSGISVGWLTLNVFGGLSFILFVGLSAGGLPGLVYGFIGSSICSLLIILVFAQCATRYSTAGGAYHYAAFLTPEKYRRPVSYVLGWFNFLGWVFTHAACCAIVATSTLALVNLCKPDFDVSTRWQLFLCYIAVAAICWTINLLGLRGIPSIEIIGCWATVLGFLCYTILLLVKAPKASARSVFVQPNNDTGYSSMSFAILLGLFNSFSSLMGLDACTHLAEELSNPKHILPRIMVIVIVSQAVVGIVWIITLGFSIQDLPAIVATKTGIPILELIRLATGSDAAAIGFCLILMINNGASALGSAVTMTRQCFAFARDGGFYWNHKLTEITSNSHMPLPVWSITMPSVVVGLIGIVYLFSNAAFNAIIGSQAVCMILSYGFPALVLLLTNRSTLPHSGKWNFGRWSNVIYIVSVLYALLVTIVAVIPQRSPVTSLTMNYTIVIIVGVLIAMAIAWWLEASRLFSPPINEEDILVVTGIPVESDEENRKGELGVTVDGINAGKKEQKKS